MGIQLVIVCVIGLLVLVYLGVRMYRTFVKKERRYRHVCHNCSMGKDCSHSRVLREECHRNGPADDQ